MCARPDCDMVYHPVRPNQRYCSPECHAEVSHQATNKSRQIKKRPRAELPFDQGAPKCLTCGEPLGFGTDGEGHTVEYCRCGGKLVRVAR